MKKARLIVSILMSAAAILLFVVLCSMEMYEAWKERTSPEDPINSSFAYVATAIAGMVASIVATALGVPIPDTPLRQQEVAAGRRSRIGVFIERVGDNITASRDEKDWKELLAVTYVAAYVVIGFAALVTWLMKSDFASSLLKTQGLTFFGMMLALVKAFVTPDPPA